MCVCVCVTSSKSKVSLFFAHTHDLVHQIGPGIICLIHGQGFLGSTFPPFSPFCGLCQFRALCDRLLCIHLLCIDLLCDRLLCIFRGGWGRLTARIRLLCIGGWGRLTAQIFACYKSPSYIQIAHSLNGLRVGSNWKVRWLLD